MKTQFMKQEDVTLLVAREDAAFTLEPLVDAMLGKGMTAEHIVDAAKRVMRLSVSDSNAKLSAAKLDAQARSVVQKLIKRMPAAIARA